MMGIIPLGSQGKTVAVIGDGSDGQGGGDYSVWERRENASHSVSESHTDDLLNGF